MAYCSQCGTQLPGDARFCPGCGAAAGGGGATAAPEPAPAAPVAPQPGYAPPPPAAAAPMQEGGKRNGFVLPVLVVVALALIAYYLLGPRTPAVQPVADAPGAGVPAADGGTTAEPAAPAAPGAGGAYTSAAALDRAFFTDPRGAAAMYPGRVEVSGTIASMVQPGPTPALSMEGRSPFNYMIVNFPAGYRTQLAPLMKGQAISVSCGSVTALGGTTILRDCLLR